MVPGRAVLCLCVGCVAFLASLLLVGMSPSVASRSEIGETCESVARAVVRLPLVRTIRDSALRAERRAQALKDMPTLLDVVTLGLSAGLSFDASLELYCDRYDTTLSSAFREAMLTWRMGIATRSQMLRDLAEELDVMALRRFAAAVTQALAFGSPLAESLEQQAQAIREEQRAQIEAEIERVPVKMLLPLAMLIVPAMLLSILGPLLGSSITLG